GVRIDVDVLDHSDIVVIQRDFPSRKTMGSIGRIFSSGKPVVYDIDDLLLDLPAGHVSRKIMEKNRTSMIEVLSRADAVTVSTEELREALSPYGDAIHVLPNLIDERIWDRRIPPSGPGPVVVGFSGTISHGNDLALIEEAVIEISERHGDRVAFRFMGCTRERIASLPGYSYIQFEPAYRSYARALQASGIEIGLVPLEDNPFNRCKSNIKWLEYAACGIVGVYPDLPPYNRCVRSGKTGLVVGNRKEDWVEGIEFLIRDMNARKLMKDEACDEALSRYSLASGAARYLETYRNVMREASMGRRWNSKEALFSGMWPNVCRSLDRLRRRLGK
ncbi:MAG: glycosyltransferase, partial [Deltaproteobacteria bacterium]|nr:glycosyltransferase [Deltaproteobacteria bacterium]